MKGFGIRRHDRAQEFEFLNIPAPEIDDTEVLVRVAAVGVGIHDQWALPPQPRYPYAIGLEGAGVIEAVGRAVQGFSPGDRVMFSGMPQAKGGTWAEYAAVAAETLTALPEALGFVEAAALPIAGTTALEGVNALGLDQGDAVFIAGASGAIGSLAMQLAKQRGAAAK
jgi:NADPH:quinone reductase-like Zn-dependent oxidoreductase